MKSTRAYASICNKCSYVIKGEFPATASQIIAKSVGLLGGFFVFSLFVGYVCYLSVLSPETTHIIAMGM